MKYLFRLIGLIFCLLAILAGGQAQDEFVGPFTSWANVKTRFRARGDGTTDDTKALQRALDSLSVQEKKFNTGALAYSVIYLPRGRYRISQS
jgi:polygalacturonase